MLVDLLLLAIISICTLFLFETLPIFCQSFVSDSTPCGYLPCNSIGLVYRVNEEQPAVCVCIFDPLRFPLVFFVFSHPVPKSGKIGPPLGFIGTTAPASNGSSNKASNARGRPRAGPSAESQLARREPEVGTHVRPGELGPARGDNLGTRGWSAHSLACLR